MLLVKSVGFVEDEVSLRSRENAFILQLVCFCLKVSVQRDALSAVCFRFADRGHVLVQTFLQLPITFYEEFTTKGMCVCVYY